MINKTKKQFEFRNCFFFAYSSLFSCLIWFILFLYFCIGIALLLREVFFLVFLVFLWFLFNTLMKPKLSNYCEFFSLVGLDVSIHSDSS